MVVKKLAKKAIQERIKGVKGIGPGLKGTPRKAMGPIRAQRKAAQKQAKREALLKKKDDIITSIVDRQYKIKETERKWFMIDSEQSGLSKTQFYQSQKHHKNLASSNPRNLKEKGTLNNMAKEWELKTSTFGKVHGKLRDADVISKPSGKITLVRYRGVVGTPRELSMLKQLENWNPRTPFIKQKTVIKKPVVKRYSRAYPSGIPVQDMYKRSRTVNRYTEFGFD